MAIKKGSVTQSRNPDLVKENILTVACQEFSNNGYSGARINVIAEKTNTSKRMLYYYFDSKEGLYRAVLERAYSNIRLAEETLQLDVACPIEALGQLVEFTFDHQRMHPEFIRLVMIENIHRAEHLKDVQVFQDINASAIAKLDRIYQQGLNDGIFRSDLSAVELHWLISSMCFFNVSNRYTFKVAYGNDLFSEKAQVSLRIHVRDMVISFISLKGTEPE